MLSASKDAQNDTLKEHDGERNEDPRQASGLLLLRILVFQAEARRRPTLKTVARKKSLGGKYPCGINESDLAIKIRMRIEQICRSKGF